MAVLDDLSEFEFEELVEDVFRKLGYENVHQAERTADEGRDVLMEEVVDGTRRAIVVEAFRDVENLDETDLPSPYAEVTFRPVVAVSAALDAVFETSVGVVHRINERPTVVVHADRGRPSLADDVATLVVDNLSATVDLDPDRFEDDFDAIEERRFGQTETEYKDWAVERLRRQYTTSVTYTRQQQRHLPQGV